MAKDPLPGEHTGFEVTKSFRIAEEVVKEAEEHARTQAEYENFSHYVRIALIRLNRYHRGEGSLEQGIEEALREGGELLR